MALSHNGLEATDALQALLDQASALRTDGREADAIALGPDILRAYYEVEQGRPLDRANASTFTEKLYRRMLDVHESGCPVYSTLSDKIRVRDHVASRIDERFLTPLLWTGDDAREIPWERLPGEVVLKCNEGSGKGALLLSPCDHGAVEAMAAGWQAESFYWRRREYHYWDVPRRLLIEPRLDDGHPDGPLDYIFFCFAGVPRLLQVGSRSHTIHRFFTPDWEPIELTYRKEYLAPPIPRPAKLDEMLEIAATLSSGFDFVRVDLYCCGTDIRFGEMTFTPCAGRVLFQPKEWDARVGEWWRYEGLPKG
ncbi:ATP-grasp fold amidoligase family protein [Caenimonas sp. SL110]|uniref:ATP-grasp fold amidoligase family protein n=1 Tax=Caenimonas sp. SL110 TaxID=1450524 RepID=UPI0006545ED7|nr:ATP-grasp fold amidoligase family protein [Caenimonas sp. SL110]